MFISFCLHLSVSKNNITQPYVNKLSGILENNNKVLNKSICGWGKLQGAHIKTEEFILLPHTLGGSNKLRAYLLFIYAYQLYNMHTNSRRIFFNLISHDV